MNSKFYKCITLFLILSLIISVTMPYAVSAKAKENVIENENTEDKFEKKLKKDNIDLNDYKFDNDKLQIEVKHPKKVNKKNKDSVIDIEIEPGSDLIYVSDKSEDTPNEDAEYTVDIETLDEKGLVATYTNTKTGEVYHYDSSVATPSAIWFAIPAGISLSAKVISALHAAGAVVIILGVAWIEVNSFISKEKNKSHSHYAAEIHEDTGRLLIGKGLTLTQAGKRLMSKKDTWSTTANNAKNAAKKASPIGKTIPAEKHGGKNMVWHFHIILANDNNGVGIRLNGVHAFYGPAS